MSTLVVSNISDGTTTVGASYVTNGSAKAWANLNGTGTIALRNSNNVSSVVDHGTGQYSFNFTNAFNAADWAGGFLCGRFINSSTGDSGAFIDNGVVSTTECRLTTVQDNGAGVRDMVQAQLSIQGDLA